MKPLGHSCLHQAELPMIKWDEAVKDATDCKNLASHLLTEESG